MASGDFDPHLVTGPMFLHEVGGNIGEGENSIGQLFTYFLLAIIIMSLNYLMWTLMNRRRVNIYTRT